MKKILSALFALVLVVSLCAVSVSAIGEEMTVLRGTPVIDGTIDAIWASADRQQLSHLKAGDLKGDGTLPDTSSAYASMLWDDGALYFLFEIYDDDFAFTADQGAWQNDSLYLYVDEESSYCATWVDGQNQLALIPAEGLTLVPRNGTAPADYEMAYSYPDENTCIIEFKYVPAIAELKAGLELMIDFQYNDATDAGTRDYCFGWSDETDGASGDSTVWGFVTLSEEAVEAEETAVEAPAADSTAEDSSTEEPAVEEPAVEPTEEPAVEEPELVEAPAAADEVEAPETATAAPQTSDVTTVITLCAMVSALCAFVISRRKANA